MVEDMFESPDTLYIVLELAEGGELFNRVVAVRRFFEPTAKLYTFLPTKLQNQLMKKFVRSLVILVCL